MTAQSELFSEPGDTAARTAIGTDLDATLFVEAGAGTGKTQALVDRVVSLVIDDVPVAAIAAITFTEKAAAELRDRVRRELRKRAIDPEVADPARARCLAALDDLDSAAICTLHAFAQRILTEFPIEVGLPPRIEVRDEISSRIAFDDRWRAFVDELLEDPELESTVLVLLASGVRLMHLRMVAEVLDDNWDLLDRIEAPRPLPALPLDGWLEEFASVCEAGVDCRADSDTMLTRLDEYAEYRDRLRAAFDDAERIELLRAEKPSFKVGTSGNKKNWGDINGLRDRIVKLGEQRRAMTDAMLDVAIKRAVAAIAVYIDRAVSGRRISGELDFHDLLVLARTLLRDPEHGGAARLRLRQRYQRILIDEFQDTDPIQVELAALLGSSDPADGARPWKEMSVDPGRLFFVGDPKQSIYRFRRADIATFLDAQDHFADPAPLFLTCNFRTGPAVLTWINHVFAELIQATPGSQPEYRALDPARTVPAEHDRGVVLLGVEPHADDGLDAATLRSREAADVAAIASAAVAEAWPVYDRDTDEWRPARLGDVCILLPARTSLGYLEQALAAAQVPYRAETSSLVYSSREIRDLLMTVRAIDDSSNTLALVSALRSSVFGCGDDDLFTFHVGNGGRWNVAAPLPEDLSPDHPVASAMRFLAELHGERLWITPSELLERIVRERSVIEIGALTGRFRDVARRVRFLIDQARAYTDAVGGTLRDYLAWAEMQGAEGARVVESVVPETDDDAVRIMTIHGAKGLEFPIVVCSGMTTQAQIASRGVDVLFPSSGGYEVKIVKGVQTAEFELHKPIDEQMGFHEKLRLLYVACTRARDHLVVSVHRKVRTLNPGDRPHWTHAELVWEAAEHAAWTSSGAPGAAVRTDVVPGEVASAPGLAPDVWQAEYDRAHDRGNRRGFVSATALAHRVDLDAGGAPAPVVEIDPGLAKDARDLELPPWNKGRYGTAIGRAVHATLQTIDLATGAGVEVTAAAQAAAEGVLGHEDTIVALARAAVASPMVQRAAACPFWRETYVAVPFDGITLEGYVDLVFRDDDGLVVVDYKTDSVDAETRAERITHYRIQAAAYALAIADATGERVVQAVLTFLDPNGATEVAFAGDELEVAMTEVRGLLAAERDHPSPRPPLVPSDA